MDNIKDTLISSGKSTLQAGAAVGGFAIEGCRKTGGAIFNGVQQIIGKPPPPPPPSNIDLFFSKVTGAFKYIGGNAHSYVQDMDKKNKRRCILVCSCLVGAGVLIGGATILLPVAGFCTHGVAGGSMAAAIQALIGNVTAGSLFASFQSAGVLGYGLGTKFLLGVSGGSVAFAFLGLRPCPEPQSRDMFDILQRHGIYGFTI